MNQMMVPIPPNDNDAPPDSPITDTDDGPDPAPVPRTYTISYTNDCFEPAERSIRKGERIKFINNSLRDMWPASDDHPQHDEYPEFDAGRSITPGDSYTFIFDKVGTWGYHDHEKPGCKGTIAVN